MDKLTLRWLVLEVFLKPPFIIHWQVNDVSWRFIVMSTSIKLSFSHKDTPLCKAIKWALKLWALMLFHSPPDQRWICKSQFFFCSVFSLQVQRQIVCVCNVNGYKYRLLVSLSLSLSLITKGHSFSCYECSGLTGSCADQKVKTCPSGSSKCMSLTTATQAGKSNMMDWNSLLHLTDGDAGVFYWCCFNGNVTLHRTADFLTEFTIIITEYSI